MKEDLFEGISKKRGNGVEIDRALCFYNPQQVYEALLHNADVRTWLNFISNHYHPSTKDVLLIYPCSADKPYHESRSYKILFNTLARLGEKRKSIHLMTISEPYGLIPEEFYREKKKWYDCPGLFKWWCAKHSQPYSTMYLDKSIEYLANSVSMFFKKAKEDESYRRVVAFVRTYTSKLKRRDDHTHRRIVERAAQIADMDVDILPDKQIVSRIVTDNGRLAWDMYGVSHPIAQEHLYKYLQGVLKQRWHTRLKRLFYGLHS